MATPESRQESAPRTCSGAHRKVRHGNYLRLRCLTQSQSSSGYPSRCSLQDVPEAQHATAVRPRLPPAYSRQISVLWYLNQARYRSPAATKFPAPKPVALASSPTVTDRPSTPSYSYTTRCNQHRDFPHLIGQPPIFCFIASAILGYWIQDLFRSLRRFQFSRLALAAQRCRRRQPCASSQLPLHEYEQAMLLMSR